MRDPESGTISMIDCSNPKVKEAVIRNYTMQLEEFKLQFKRAKCDTMSLSTDQSYIQELHRFFKRRASA
jgi:hypothetical protein